MNESRAGGRHAAAMPRPVGAMVKTIVATFIAVLCGVAPGLGVAGPTPTPPPAKEANNQFSDWFVNTTPSYFPSPFLTDSTANAVSAFLQNLPAGSIRAVKVERPISAATSNLIFNNPSYNVSYVFGDLETGDPKKQLTDLVRQVRFVNGQNNGTRTRSFNAFVGSYGFQAISNDLTHPNNYRQNSKDEHSFSGHTTGDFQSTKANLHMPELYPGSGSNRTPAAGNSSAPNIRSALFAMPVLRLSQVAVNVKADERVIPWVARFNNYGNLALDTDRNPANGFKFEPGKSMPAAFGLPAVSAALTTDQMLSRRDFAAQIAHYRLRGADSFVLFEPGVLGYLQEDKRNDARIGWTEPHIDGVFKAADATILIGKHTDYKNGNNPKDINQNIFVDGKDRTVEQSGAMFSGVFSLTLKKMEVLLSNMDDEEHLLTLPEQIAGFTLKDRSFELDGGSHLLIEYKLTTSGLAKGWSVALQQFPFLTLNNNRSGIGVPEPTTLSILAGVMFIAFSPRRRRRSS